ncbi:hypothetical protein ACLB2K_022179 [Fragaria x ananassa]
MILSPKSTPPELNPSESTPSKRQNSTSSQSDQEPSSSVQDSSSPAKPMTYEEHFERAKERAPTGCKDDPPKEGNVPYSISTLPTINLPESLPEGCAWGCYIPGGKTKDFVYKMVCLNCGKDRAHLTHNCPYKNTQEAKEFRKKYLGMLPSHETKPENK